MKNKSILLMLVCCFFAQVKAQKQPVDYVNTIIGATTAADGKMFAYDGKTFPGAATPFGLVQLSPDTKTGGDHGPGYSWHHKTIEGFSFTHMSGIGWYGDLGNFLVMPTVGELHTAKGSEEYPEEGYRSRYSHDSEVTEAGYYAVTLDDYRVRTELTVTPRTGIIRFTFPEHAQSRIQIDLARRIGGTSTEQRVEKVDDHTIQGWMRCTPDGGGWGDGYGNANYTVYFYCQFEKPFEKYGVWSVDVPAGLDRKNRLNEDPEWQKQVAAAKVMPMCSEAEGKHLGFYTEFATQAGEQVLMKCGISFVSIDGARNNLEQELPHWNFEKVRKEARKSWNKALSCIEVKGKSERDKRIFYTGLYHTMIDPRCYSDVDGNYVGADGQIHQAKDFVYRTIFSGWDVFRSQFPLQNLINPQLVTDEINSLIQIGDLSGRHYFPRWEFLNAYSGCMVGNPAIAVITDAYVKGIRGFDARKAAEYCENSMEKFGNGEQGFVSGNLSETLEYAYFDWCTGKLWESLGDQDKAQAYYRKGQAYRNVWNPEVRWFQARQSKDRWLNWQGKTVGGQGCVESNPFQQGWFVPHDIEGMKALMGEDFFIQELELFFDRTTKDFLWSDYYNHPNEPDHHVPFLFNYSSKPWLTQKWTRQICKVAYGDDVLGLCGNEDVGQMSAWYILAAVGFHPVCPGSTRYELTSPVFDEVVLKLDRKFYPGKKFVVKALNNSSENVYIQKIWLNGKPLDRLWISHDEIISGGELVFELGDTPNKSLGL